MIVAGLDIGGTKCAAVLAETTENGVVFLEREQIATKRDWRSILDKLCGSVRSFEKKRGVKAEAAGISCGGPLSAEEGLILSPPNLPGWENAPACAYVAERLALPARKVRLKNDADACALAEWKYGAGRGTRNMIFLTFGTGLGAGLILNGGLYTGGDGTAGEVGHIRLKNSGPIGYGKAGSFEGFCSGGGILQLADEYFGEKLRRGEPCPYYRGRGSVSAKLLGEKAAENDADALAVFSIVGEYFGKGLAVLIDLLNPDAIVAGSIYARCEKYIAPSMQKVLKEECLSQPLARVKILPSGLGEKIGDYGAVCAAF